MKIKDLMFGPHPACSDGTQATHTFPNGYTASVITGSIFYTSTDSPYEIAIIANGELVYDTEITSDVLVHLSEDQANETLKRIEALPLREKS